MRPSRRLLRRPLTSLVLGLAAVSLLGPADALAGRLVVSGHDSDLHCGGQAEQCHFVKVGVSSVRAGAPEPTKPVLVLDRLDLDMVRALDAAFGAGAVPRTVLDPRSPAFASAPITTSAYSAVLVASDTTCGGCDLNESSSTPDSDAINARKADFEKFFNAGGGLFVGAGANHADGMESTGVDNFYSFLPLPVGGVAVAPPFTLTETGKTLGFEDSTNSVGTNDDINCCRTHNSFKVPAAGGALKVAETDSGGSAETLVAQGRISGGGITDTPEPKAKDVIKLPSSKKCVSRRKFRIRLKQPKGLTIAAAVVTVNGRKVKTVKGKRVKAPVDLLGLPQGRFTVRISVLLSNGKALKGTRKYRTCTKKRKGSNKGPL